MAPTQVVLVAMTTKSLEAKIFKTHLIKSAEQSWMIHNRYISWMILCQSYVLYCNKFCFNSLVAKAIGSYRLKMENCSNYNY